MIISGQPTSGLSYILENVYALVGIAVMVGIIVDIYATVGTTLKADSDRLLDPQH